MKKYEEMSFYDAIYGLEMGMDLALYNPTTGDELTPDDLNTTNRIEYESEKFSFDLLKEIVLNDSLLIQFLESKNPVISAAASKEVNRKLAAISEQMQYCEHEPIDVFQTFVDSLKNASNELQGKADHETTLEDLENRYKREVEEMEKARKSETPEIARIYRKRMGAQNMIAVSFTNKYTYYYRVTTFLSDAKNSDWWKKISTCDKIAIRTFLMCNESEVKM